MREIVTDRRTDGRTRYVDDLASCNGIGPPDTIIQKIHSLEWEWRPSFTYDYGSTPELLLGTTVGLDAWLPKVIGCT